MKTIEQGTGKKRVPWWAGLRARCTHCRRVVEFDNAQEWHPGDNAAMTWTCAEREGGCGLCQTTQRADMRESPEVPS